MSINTCVFDLIFMSASVIFLIGIIKDLIKVKTNMIIIGGVILMILGFITLMRDVIL